MNARSTTANKAYFLKMDRSDARRQRFKNSPCPGLRRALDTIIETRDEVHLSPSYHNQPYRLDDFSGKPHERKSKILKLGVVGVENLDL